MTKSAERHFLVSISDVDGFFTTKTGGESSMETSHEFDGGSNDPDIMGGPPIVGDLTIGRAFDPARDAAFLKRCEARVGRNWKTITVQPTTPDFVRTGPPTSYRGLLKAVNPPDTDANSAAAARYSLVYAIKGKV